MVDRHRELNRELKRLQTSSTYLFGRNGLPASHALGTPAYSPLARRDLQRMAVYVYNDDALSRCCI